LCEDRLAALCAAAGYPPELIADSVLPGYTPGQALTERQLGWLCEAARTLIEAGRDQQQLAALIAGYKQTGGEDWQEAFWDATLTTAAARQERRARPSARSEHAAPARRSPQARAGLTETSEKKKGGRE
jgi:hypothetical protein